MEKGPKRAFLRRLLQIRILEYNCTVLPSKLHQTRLEVPPTHLRNNTPNHRAAGKVDLLDQRIFNQRSRNGRRIFRAVREHTEASIGQTSVFKNFSNCPVAARRELRAFEDGGVTGGEGVDSSAEAEDVGCVPG